LIDNRTVCHGALVASFVDASTTAAATYGRFVFTYALQFRYPVNASVIGSPQLTDHTNYDYITSSSGEMKDKSEQKTNELTSSALADSYTLVLKKKPGK